MAIIVSNGNVSLSTASAFDSVECSNMGMFSATSLALTSSRQINFTPTSTRNSKGVILCLIGGSSTNNRSVKVDLCDGSTVLQTVTLTSAQISNSVANSSGGWIVYFDYTDNSLTSAHVYNFKVVQTGGSVGTWSIKTSDATNAFFIEVPDKAVTATTGDTIIFKDKVTWDVTPFTLGPGQLGTGDAANAVSGVFVKCPSAPTSANTQGNLVWDTTAARSLTLDGMLITSAHTAWRIGTSGSRCTKTNLATITFANRSAGTVTSGIYGTSGTVADGEKKQSLFWYGELPTNAYGTLQADTTVGGGSFKVTQDVTAGTNPWASGERVAVGKQTAKGAGDTAIYTISGTPTWDGTKSTVSLTGTLATNVRKTGGHVIRLEGYGIKLISNTTNRGVVQMRHPSNFVFDGIEVEETTLTLGQSASFANQDDTANRSQPNIKNCSWYHTSGGSLFAVNGILVESEGFLIDKVYAYRINTANTPVFQSGVSGTTTLSNCITIGISGASQMTTTSKAVYTNNVVENVINGYSLAGKLLTFTGNSIWGSNLSSGAVALTSVIAPSSISGNIYDNNSLAIGFAATAVKVVETNSFFGSTTANTADFSFTADAYFDYTLVNPSGALTVTTTNEADTISGSHFRVTNYNLTANDYRAWYTEGSFLSNGSNLEQYTSQSTDTLSAVYNLKSGAVSTFAVRAYITCTMSNAGYYAGVNTLPTLSVAYDTSSTASGVASATTSAQTLAASFTPATDNNAIAISLRTQTDAGATNSKVTWSGLTVNVRKYGYVFSTSSIPIAETTESVLATLTTPASNTFVVLSQAAAHALTGIAYNSGTNTITITSDHTISEVYDYFQDWGTLNMGSAVPFDTTDGITYNCAANLTLNGGNLSGSGHTVHLSLPAYTFTKTSGDTTATVTDSTGRTVPLIVSGIVSGAIVRIEKASDGTQIFQGTATGSTLQGYYVYTTDVTATLIVRKFGYLEYRTTVIITNFGVSQDASLFADPNSAVYTVGIGSDWTIDTAAFSITHTSGTTVYTTRDLYNYTMDYFANTLRMAKLLPMSAQTQFDFSFENSYTIPDASTHYLSGGSLTTEGGNALFSNVYTIGVPTGTQIYIDQDGSTLSGWWGSGNIDIVLRVKTAGALIDSGIVSVRSHRFNHIYDRQSASLGNGGRSPIAISAATDSDNATALATVAGYSDIIETEASLGTSGNLNGFIHATHDHVLIPASSTYYLPVGGITHAFTTEIQAQVPYNTSGVISGLYVYVITNDLGASTVTLRKNGADTSLTVTVGASGTGASEDLTHTVTVAAGDKLSWKVVTGAGATGFNINAANFLFTAGTNQMMKYTTTLWGAATAFGSNAITNWFPTYYNQPAWNATNAYLTESDTTFTIGRAGTFKNLSVYIISNANPNTTHFTLRKNGSDTALTVSVASGVTGLVEDLTHTVSVSASDVLTISAYMSAVGSGSMEIAFTTMEFVVTDRIVEYFTGNPGKFQLAGATNYTTVQGPLGYDSTYTSYEVPSGIAATLSHLRFGTVSNTLSGNLTITLLKNGVATSLQVVLASAGTFVEDSTHTVTVVATDKLSYQVVGAAGTGQVTMNWITLRVENTETSSATPFMEDIGDGLGASPYNIAFDAAGRTVQEFYEWTKYLTRDASGEVIQSLAGELWESTAGGTEIVSAPLGTFAGGLYLGPQGIWLENVDPSDALNYILTDNDGITHQAPTPPVALTVTDIIDGSRIQLYDIDDSTELANEIVSGTSFSFIYTYPGSDHTIRIRLSYVNGTSAYKFYEVNTTATAAGFSAIAAQEVDTVYNTIGLDGSMITEFSVSGSTIKVFIDDPDNTTTIQRIFSWFCYVLFTESGIRDQGYYIRATDSTNFVFYSAIQIKNLDLVNPLIVDGGYFVLSTGGTPVDCYDTTGGPIFMGYPHVVGLGTTSGSGMTVGQFLALK